ncbi:adenosine receptor A2b-like [Oculina patagonica]
MTNSSCELLLQSYPRDSEVEHLRSTNIANCVLNNFLCYTAIMLNIVTIHAIRKTSSLPMTLKTLLLSVAVSDVGVGLFVQPFYTSLLVKWLQPNNSGCNKYAFVIISSSFCLASFSSVVAVSVDRFLALHLHLRYQELVTYKRVVSVVISIWVLSVFFPLMALWVLPNIYSLMTFILGIVGLVLTTLIYIKIYLTVRRHKIQIHALQVQDEAENGEVANFASLIKSAVGIFYVYLVFLICYLPFLVCLAAIEVNGPSIPLKRVFLFSLTLIFLNSSVNPAIYCWKMRHIRHAIMDILRNMSWLRNRASY